MPESVATSVIRDQNARMQTSDFDYYLPEELIAQEPLEDRAASRMLVLHRASGEIRHTVFRDLLNYVHPEDTLVINDTRVSAFRLHGHKPTGGLVEALVLEQLPDGAYRALMKPGRRLHVGDRIWFSENLEAAIVRRDEDATRILRFESQDVEGELKKCAEVPLPPYIKTPLVASERYQTVYNGAPGSSAAPTAGLHFTPQVMEDLEAQGIRIVRVTLHVGASTFRPIRDEFLDNHKLTAERIVLSEQAAEQINQTKGRIIAVGTTSTRTLEAAAVADRRVQPVDGQTDLFIKPGHQFRVVDMLLTNFHMPRSTLFMLVSAFAGRENLLAAYGRAVEERYRFLSLGDAMLVV